MTLILVLGISPIGATVLLSDSFEGSVTSPSKLDGWVAEWSMTGGNQAGTYESGLQTITVPDPAPGGGPTILQQWWHSNLLTYSPAWPRYFFQSFPNDGDVLELEYYLKYDANFNFGSSQPTLKGIRLWDKAHTATSLDLNTHHQNNGKAFQMIEIQANNFPFNHWYKATTNGSKYVMPTDEWVHFRWRIKKATEGSGNKNGYVYGWINGQLRYKYENMYTCPTGKDWGYLEVNATFNNSVKGPDNKRYWDSFKINLYPNGSNPPAAQTLTVNNGVVYNGIGTGEFMSGSTARIQSATPPPGQQFDHWTGDVTHVADVNSADTTVTMPSSAVNITATYKNSSPPPPPNPGWGNYDDFEDIRKVHSDWDGTGWSFIHPAPAHTEVETITTSDTPPGGGAHVFKQVYDPGRPDWLRLNANSLTEGQVVEMSYWIKYHPEFQIANTAHKSVIIRGNNSLPGSQIYINSWRVGGGAMQFFLQNMLDPNDPSKTTNIKYGASVNGGSFLMPVGEWVHFRWQWKISSQDMGAPNGFIYGWVTRKDQNGKYVTLKRWERVDVHTNRSSNNISNRFEMAEWTMNSPNFPGPKQIRYWDNIYIGPPTNSTPPPTNQAPTAHNDNRSTSINTPIQFTLLASDPDSDPLSTSIINGPQNGSLNTSNFPAVTYTPNTDYTGSDAFTFKVNDGQLDSNVATVTLQISSGTPPPNQPPVVDSLTHDAIDADPNLPGVQVEEGSTVVYSGSVSDPDNNPVSWEWLYKIDGGAEIVINNGVYPTKDVATISFEYPVGTAGRRYTWILRAYDGHATAEEFIEIEIVKRSIETGADLEEEEDVPFKNILDFSKDNQIEIACDNNISIWSRNGESVKDLSCPTGRDTVIWDGTANGHQKAASGVYILVEDNKENRKVVVIR